MLDFTVGIILVMGIGRSAFFGQDTWDLLALAILGSLGDTIYLAYQRVVSRRWLTFALVIGLVSAVLAALLAWLLS